MTDNNALDTVPDTSMATLFKGLVAFLIEEADGRGWTEVTGHLQAVEAALRTRIEAKP